MTFEEFKNMLKIEPAKITAEVDDKGKVTCKVEGRQSELIPLLATLSLQIIEECSHPIDEYCEFLKFVAEQRMLMPDDSTKKATDNIIKGVFD